MTDAPSRSLLVVAGPGRSGTSVITGLLGRIGYWIPQPEVAANASNPRGFGEPRWVVEFHKALLEAARVLHGDARPDAAPLAREAAARPEVGDRAVAWLEEQFAESDNVVIKDPRLLWFTDLWSRSAAELGARTVALTMLRHPVPVTKSSQTHYMALPVSTRVAAWTNGALVTERNTRDLARTSVVYNDLLQDWKSVLESALAPVGLPSVSSATPEQVAAGDELVDPRLRRSVSSWDELAVTESQRALAEKVYDAVCDRDRPGVDQAASAAVLDDLAAEYRAMYEHAEAIVHSTLKQARRLSFERGVRSGRKAAADEAKKAREAKAAEKRAAQAARSATPSPSTARRAVRRLRRSARRVRRDWRARRAGPSA